MGVAALGVVLLGGVASMAAADVEVGSDEVTLSVEVAPISEPGVLAMSVAADAASLGEVTVEGDTYRTFSGVLPTVTVTDTRAVEEIDPAAFWSVLGTVSDFSSGSDVIAAEHLGWSPQLLVDGEGVVGEGDEVGTVLDGDPGLVDAELLFYSSTSAEAQPGSPWSANADLTLKTPLDVEPGSYTSTLTLSLFE